MEHDANTGQPGDDSFSVHEALQTAYLLQHPVIASDPALQKQVAEVSDGLATIYQAIGAASLQAPPADFDDNPEWTREDFARARLSRMTGWSARRATPKANRKDEMASRFRPQKSR